MSEHPTTDNHDYARPDPGTLEGQWGQVINQDLIDPLEEEVPTVGDPSNYTPYADAIHFDTGTNELLIGDGSSWNSWDLATEGWVDSNYNDYTFSEQYGDLSGRNHGNEDHTETFATDGDAQPPENHDNAAHLDDFAYSSTHSDVDIQIDETAGTIDFVTN